MAQEVQFAQTKRHIDLLQGFKIQTWHKAFFGDNCFKRMFYPSASGDNHTCNYKFLVPLEFFSQNQSAGNIMVYSARNGKRCGLCVF